MDASHTPRHKLRRNKQRQKPMPKTGRLLFPMPKLPGMHNLSRRPQSTTTPPNGIFNTNARDRRIPKTPHKPNSLRLLRRKLGPPPSTRTAEPSTGRMGNHQIPPTP